MATICEQFVGRRRDLCEGRGRDGRADPPADISAKFRRQFGLAPLADDPAIRAQQLAEIGDVVAANPAVMSVPATGPGRQLEAIFGELHISSHEACGCAAYARQLDVWGVAGCREHFEEIVDRLRISATKSSFQEKWKAAGRALITGWIFWLRPWNPFPDLVRVAIRRAEVEGLSAGP